MQDDRDDRHRELMATMAARLSRVRGQMTDAEFGQLLADVVRTAKRFAELDAKPDAAIIPTDPKEIRRLLGIEDIERPS